MIRKGTASLMAAPFAKALCPQARGDNNSPAPCGLLKDSKTERE